MMRQLFLCQVSKIFSNYSDKELSVIVIITHAEQFQQTVDENRLNCALPADM